MILQSVVFSDKICDKTSLFLRMTKNAYTDGKSVVLTDGADVSTDTYMNFFDSVFWSKYTGISSYRLDVLYEGEGVIEIGTFDEIECHAIEKHSISSNTPVMVSYILNFEKYAGNIYFRCISQKKLIIYDACYATEYDASSDTRLGIVFCTYRRQKDIKRNINTILKSRFFDKDNELFGNLEVVVVDNGRQLSSLDYENVKIISNKNVGGAGGFARGISEMSEPGKNVTDICLMDDDVTFINETLYRLYALISLRKSCYNNDVVAGRMFRKDKTWVQYTACEIWNSGDIIHIGHNCDMTVKNNIVDVNNGKGEYSGWWMCCFPKKFLAENSPMPFFLHCDDVELGLRHGGTPVILNGVQVWHETYEYRQNTVVAYYDMRNTLFVNEITGYMRPEKELENWKKKISYAHKNKDYNLEYLLIKAMNDYLKGIRWLNELRTDRYHEHISRKRILVRYRNILFWRMVYYKYKKRFGIK